MSRLRRLVFWSHLAVGVTAGLVILIMSATGAMLAFEPQMLAFINRDVRRVEPPAPGAARLPIATLVDRAAAGRGEPATGVTLETDPHAAVLVAFGSDGTLYVDPYTGGVLGEPSARARDAFRAVTNWHRWLAATVERRAVPRAITGASNLGFLLLAVSGVYLWWPRSWAPRRLRSAMRFDPGARGKARDFNWHTVIGFWCAPLLVVLTATGAVMSYSWANNLVYRVMGSPVPERRAARPAASGGPIASASETGGGDAVAWDRLVGEAENLMPTWDTMAIRADRRSEASITLTDGAFWNAFARSTLTLDAATGAVGRWAPYAEQSAGQKARGWIRFAHTGELGGPVGQVLAFVACVGGVVLVWTGLALAWRRFTAWRRVEPRAMRRAA